MPCGSICPASDALCIAGFKTGWRLWPPARASCSGWWLRRPGDEVGEQWPRFSNCILVVGSGFWKYWCGDCSHCMQTSRKQLQTVLTYSRCTPCFCSISCRVLQLWVRYSLALLWRQITGILSLWPPAKSRSFSKWFCRVLTSPWKKCLDHCSSNSAKAFGYPFPTVSDRVGLAGFSVIL